MSGSAAGPCSQAPPSCHAEAAGGGLPGESLGHVRQGLPQGRGVDSGGGDGLPGNLVLPGLDALRIAHSGLQGVLDGLGFRLGLLDQGLELAQLPDFRFHFVDAHCVGLLVYSAGTPAAVVVRAVASSASHSLYRSALIRDLGVRLQRLPVSELFSFVPLL